MPLKVLDRDTTGRWDTPAMRVVTQEDIPELCSRLVYRRVAHFVTPWGTTVRDGWAVYVDGDDEPALANAIQEMTV
jgi:hypothetical protein